MIRTAPHRSHVSRCPPRTAVRQAAIARSARAGPSRAGASDDSASPCARTMSASSSRGGARAPAVPIGTAHTGQLCGGGANRASRSSGEPGPISVCRVN